jgi:hypothetical protein
VNLFLLLLRIWDVGGLASIITEQQSDVGSAVKIGERNTEAVAVGSVINMTQFSDVPCMRSITDFVLSRFQGDTRAQFSCGAFY